MVYYDIYKMLEILNLQKGKKINLSNLSKESGASRKAISRMINQPEISPSSAIVNKLVQYFHSELKTTIVLDSKKLYDHILSRFIDFDGQNNENYQKIQKLKEIRSYLRSC